MNSFFNPISDLDISVQCPECGDSLTEKMRALNDSRKVSCPTCGEQFNVTEDDLKSPKARR